MVTSLLRSALLVFAIFALIVFLPHDSSASEKNVRILRVQSEDLSDNTDTLVDEPQETSPKKMGQLGTDRANKRWEEARQRSQVFRDEQKQEVFLRILDRLETIQQNATDRMATALEKLTTLLGQMTESKTSLAGDGVDTSSLDQCILLAQSSITTAQSAIEEQASKDYTLDTSDGTLLRQTLGQVVSQMRQDMRDTWKKVVDAKQDVRTCAAELMTLQTSEQDAPDTNPAAL